MKILIAGGAGYIGSVLIPKLFDRGYQVDVVDLFWFGNHLPDETGIIHKDIFDLTEADLAGYDQVVFLAGLSNDPMAEFAPSKNFVYNAAAPAYLAYVAKKAGGGFESWCTFRGREGFRESARCVDEEDRVLLVTMSFFTSMVDT